MGKRKRRPANSSATTPARQGKSVRPDNDGGPPVIRRWRRPVTALVIGGTLVAVGALTLLPSLRPPVAAPPTTDLSTVEPVIAGRIATYLEGVEARPRSPARWGKLAMVYDIHNFERAAVICYKQAAALDRNDFRWAYFGAIALGKVQDTETDQWWDRALEMRPDYTPLLLRQGRRLLDAGKLDEATELYRRALETGEHASHAYRGLGEIAMVNGDLTEARRFLERGLDVNYRYGELHHLLAEVFRRLGDTDASDRERTVAAQLNALTPYPDPVSAQVVHEGVGSQWAIQRGNAYLVRSGYQLAAREFRESVRLRPSAEALAKLGLALHRLGQPELAVEHLRAALALEPNSMDGLVNMGAALLDLGRTQEAMEHLRRAESLNPRSLRPDIVLATHYQRAGDWERAVATLRRARRKQPEDIPTAGNLAWLLVTAPEPVRDPEEAVRLAQWAASMTMSRDPETLMVLAEAHFLSGDTTKAIEATLLARRAAAAAGASDQVGKIDSQLQGLRAPNGGRRLPAPARRP